MPLVATLWKDLRGGEKGTVWSSFRGGAAAGTPSAVVEAADFLKKRKDPPS